MPYTLSISSRLIGSEYQGKILSDQELEELLLAFDFDQSNTVEEVCVLSLFYFHACFSILNVALFRMSSKKWCGHASTFLQARMFLDKCTTAIGEMCINIFCWRQMIQA
jgi:hypothetical protein